MSQSKSPARVLLYDIETTNLNADFGFLVCVGYKWLGEKRVYVARAESLLDEKQLVKEFMKVYNSADLLVTYNGKRFDTPYLVAKCLEHKLPLPPNTPHVDLYQTVRHNLRISRKSLQNVGYHLGLSNEKTPVEGRIWRDAATGHAKSVKYIIDHCKADVLLLEEAYLRLRPLVRQHPRVASVDACSACGSLRLQRRGRALTTLRGERQRYRCKDCGHWSSRPYAP